MTSRIERAREMALAAHGEQKYGDHPYSYHLEQVVAICKPYGEDTEIVAWLHDTVEDTELTVAEIEATFGRRVAKSVEALTDPPGKNRKTRKANAHKKLSEIRVHHQDLSDDCIALLVKAADRIANVSECIRSKNEGVFRMYQAEQEAFKSAVLRYRWNEVLMTRLDELFELDWPHPLTDPIQQARRDGAAICLGLIGMGKAISSPRVDFGGSPHELVSEVRARLEGTESTYDVFDHDG